MRNQNQKYPLIPEQIEELKEELHSLGNTDEERILICKTALFEGGRVFIRLTSKITIRIQKQAPARQEEKQQ